MWQILTSGRTLKHNIWRLLLNFLHTTPKYTLFIFVNTHWGIHKQLRVNLWLGIYWKHIFKTPELIWELLNENYHLNLMRVSLTRWQKLLKFKRLLKIIRLIKYFCKNHSWLLYTCIHNMFMHGYKIFSRAKCAQPSKLHEPVQISRYLRGILCVSIQCDFKTLFIEIMCHQSSVMMAITS